MVDELVGRSAGRVVDLFKYTAGQTSRAQSSAASISHKAVRKTRSHENLQADTHDGTSDLYLDAGVIGLDSCRR